MGSPKWSITVGRAYQDATEAFVAEAIQHDGTPAVVKVLVARPGQGFGLKSAFLSDVFHAGLAQRPIRLPVSDAATMWLMSGQCAADNLARALLLPAASMPCNGTLTLPALRVRMSELVGAIARHTGHAPQVDYAPDPLIERDFGAYPPLRTPDASVLGLAHDDDLDRLVAAAMESLT